MALLLVQVTRCIQKQHDVQFAITKCAEKYGEEVCHIPFSKHCATTAQRQIDCEGSHPMCPVDNPPA